MNIAEGIKLNVYHWGNDPQMKTWHQTSIEISPHKNHLIPMDMDYSC